MFLLSIIFLIIAVTIWWIRNRPVRELSHKLKDLTLSKDQIHNELMSTQRKISEIHKINQLEYSEMFVTIEENKLSRLKTEIKSLERSISELETRYQAKKKKEAEERAARRRREAAAAAAISSRSSYRSSSSSSRSSSWRGGGGGFSGGGASCGW